MRNTSQRNLKKIVNNEEISSRNKGLEPILNRQSVRPIRFTIDEDNSLQKSHELSNNSRILASNRSFEKQQSLRKNLLNELSTSRKIQQCSPTNMNKKYQYGDEGVKVCSQVIQKYKASNYSIQRDMLQKFKREAEQFRKNRNNRFNKNESLAPISNTFNMRQPRPFHQMTQMSPVKDKQTFQNVSFLQLKHQEQLRKCEYDKQIIRRNKAIQEQLKLRQQHQKQQIKKQEERKKRRIRKKDLAMKREKENLAQVGNMLRDIDNKIKQNSSQLAANIRDLRNQLKVNNICVKSSTIFKSDGNDNTRIYGYGLPGNEIQSQESWTKIPIVMYNNKFKNEMTYFSEESLIPERIDRNSYKNNADNMKQVLQILHKNEERLKLLTEDMPENRFVP